MSQEAKEKGNEKTPSTEVVAKAKRRQVLADAYAKNPERFVKGAPVAQPLPEAVWINPPKPSVKPEEKLPPS